MIVQVEQQIKSADVVKNVDHKFSAATIAFEQHDLEFVARAQARPMCHAQTNVHCHDRYIDTEQKRNLSFEQ